jgi:hypothetical protein
MADHTKQQLVDAAKAAGHVRVSARLVDDWVALGLLDHPERHPRGYGRGSAPATWPDNQRELFLQLLAKRGEAKTVAVLCNVPVWLWLWWGDGFVPLRQLRRAMATWAKAAREPARGRAAAAVSALIADWGAPDAPKRVQRQLAEALYPMVSTGRVNVTTLRPLLDAAWVPKKPGRGNTDPGVSVSVDGYLQLLRARVDAVHRLAMPEGSPRFEGGKRIEPIGDALYEWARLTYLTTRQSYGARLAAAGKLPDDLSDIAMSACLDLATMLGLGLIGPVGAPPTSPFNPEPWRREGLRSTLETTAGPKSINVQVRVSRPSPDKDVK